MSMDNDDLVVGEVTEVGDNEALPTLDFVEKAIKSLKKGEEVSADSSDSLDLDDVEKTSHPDFEPDFKALEEDSEDKPDQKEEQVAEKIEESKKDGPNAPLGFKDYIEQLPENTKILHKVDGQEVEVDVKDAMRDMLNKYSGEKSLEKRHFELDKKEKVVYNIQQEQETILKTFDQFRDAKDILGGYAYIGSLTGTPPHVILEQIIQAATPIIERRYGLTNEQIQLEYTQAENQYLLQQKEAELRARKETKALEERNSAITKLRETHQIDEKSWNDAYNELDSTLHPNEPITPKMVVDKVLSKQSVAKSDTIVSDLAKKYNLSEEDVKGVEAVVKQYPQLSKDDIDSLIKESIEEFSKKEKEKQLASKLAQKQHKNSASNESEDDMLEAMSKKMLEELGLK